MIPNELINTIVKQDATEYLSSLPDESVDLFIIDPPYNIGFDGNKGWDKQWKTEEEYLLWCKGWLEQAWRALKTGRVLVVWGTLKTDTFLKFKLQLLNELPGALARTEIIWENNWGGRSKKDFARKHEYAWVYSKGENVVWNPNEVRIPRKMKKNIRTGEDYTEGTIPTAIWQLQNHTTSKDYVGWHSTPKNLDAIGRLVKAYSNIGDIVVDPFMGSASTAVAAVRASRFYSGCELDDEFLEKSAERIRKSVPKTLFDDEKQEEGSP